MNSGQKSVLNLLSTVHSTVFDKMPIIWAYGSQCCYPAWLFQVLMHSQPGYLTQLGTLEGNAGTLMAVALLISRRTWRWPIGAFRGGVGVKYLIPNVRWKLWFSTQEVASILTVRIWPLALSLFNNNKLVLITSELETPGRVMPICQYWYSLSSQALLRASIKLCIEFYLRMH